MSQVTQRDRWDNSVPRVVLDGTCPRPVRASAGIEHAALDQDTQMRMLLAHPALQSL